MTGVADCRDMPGCEHGARLSHHAATLHHGRAHFRIFPFFRQGAARWRLGLCQGAKIAISKTMVWPQAGYGLVDAMIRAIELLRAEGAIVDEIEFPDSLQELPNWYNIIFNSDGRTAFLPEYRVDKTRIADQLVGHVENRLKISRAAQVKAFDDIAAARPVVDGMLSQYDAVLTPSVPDEAPEGIESTGSAAFCQIWTASDSFCAHGLD